MAQKSAALVHTGEVVTGLAVMAASIQKSQNEMEKRWLTGNTTTSSSAIVHALPKNIMDVNTYPDTCLWARKPQICPDPNVKTIQDCYNDWHRGSKGGPPIRLLEEKYKFHWRKKNTKIARAVKMYKNVAAACANTSVAAVQQDLYSFFGAISAEEKIAHDNITRIREFNEKVLVPAQPDYAAKRAAASIVRQKGLKKPQQKEPN